jgi:hypothetical protein
MKISHTLGYLQMSITAPSLKGEEKSLDVVLSSLR